MAPKKPKDATLDENYWRTYIEDAVLNEEFWNVKVILIEAAGNDQDRIYLNKFETFAAEERRFVIKNICKTETIFMVNQLGGEKKVKDDNLRVFEEGQMYLKDKKDIPPDILALIIKYLILKMKDEYLFIKRQRLEVRDGMRRESNTMISRAEVRGTVTTNIPVEEKIQDVQYKEKNKKDDLEPLPPATEPTEGKKYNTMLRVRGEEWRDKTYVDDFPTDGPNLYVAITGFTEPHLAGCLIKIGVPLTALVQIRINPENVKVPSGLFRTTKRGQSQTEILTTKSQKFWEDLQDLRIHVNTCDDYKDTAFIVFSPPYWETDSLSGNSEIIYDELCFLMYDIQDLTRQHNHYLDNMEVINIPIETENEQDQKYYHQHIEELPLECITTYSVLDSILQAVCCSLQTNEKSSTTSLSTAITLNQPHQSSKDDNKVQKAQTLIKDVFNVLCNPEATKKIYRISYGEEYEKHKDPIVINYGDFAKLKVFQLGNINMENIVRVMLHGIPIFTLWKNLYRQSQELEAKINFHVNVLLSCFERKDIETVELNRLIHILACRKMYNNRSSLKVQHLPPTTITEFKKVFLKRTVLAEPLPMSSASYRSWSSMSPPFAFISQRDNKIGNIDGNSEEFRIKYLFDCPDISELVSAAEIASNTPISHMIDDFEFFEEFSNVSAYQTMVNAFNTFNCVDYKYCEVTDSIILMFFNSYNKDGISREEWRCHLPTPLCLQDFFDFVLEEHYDWIQKEEEMYVENTIQRSQSIKNVFDVFAERNCIENTENNVDLLMEGSIKYQEMGEEEALPENTEIKTKTTTVSPSTTDMTTKSSKKTKSAVSTPKSGKQPFFVADSISSVEIPVKPFSGYNLSDRRVEIFGKDSCFFSKDGTIVLTKYTIMIPGNSEYIVLKVAPGNANTEFWMHKALGDVQPRILDMCESFRISNKDDVMIYVKKQSYAVPLPALDVSCIERPTEKDKKSSPHTYSFSKLQMVENKSFHSLNVTWPNGLITESVHENNSAHISHIKQFYVKPIKNLDEEMRCISLNGEVIIFKISGLIEVLRPNGSFIKITKCEKRMNQETFEDLQSDTSSDKTKKGKGKEKNKPSKSSSKTSKNIIEADEKPSDIKQPEYALFIDEFETIEADGLKQKWINDIPIDTKKLLVRTATDFCSGEVFSRRMDGTNTLLNKDGVQIITFPDNTRIISIFTIEEDEIYPEWTEEEIEYFAMFDSDNVETDTVKSKSTSSRQSYGDLDRRSTSVHSSNLKKINDSDDHQDLKNKERNDGYISVLIIYTIEHKNFATVTLNTADGMITVTSPNNVKVVMGPENNFKFTLDSVTSAEFNGQDLNINYKACPQCVSDTTCKVKIKYDEIPSATNFQKCWLKMEDSFNKKISVNDEGNISVIEDALSDEVAYEEYENKENNKNENKCRKTKSENSIEKCRELYEANAMRFFILRRELSCSELVHRALIEQYKKRCRWQPWCSINQYDTFGDNRSIVSILTPIHLTETEKWLMESQFADKPKYLTYKDLKEDSGKGFYHWMRPYGRFQPKYLKPENVVPDGLPRAFVLRNLEQQWGDVNREKLKGGKELLTAILRYRQLMESNSDTILYVPIRDPRPEDERTVDEIIQAIATTTYEDLKNRLAEDVQKRAKPTITTKPLIRSEESSMEGELEELPDELTTLEERRASLVKEVEAAEEMSPNLKRYWRRRAEEYKEEQFYKYLLREGSVPPYFRNVLGGAIWWEMNNLTDEATVKAERRKMKCVCEVPGETSSQGDVTAPSVMP